MDRPRITRVLVTGARGFIGSNLCELLLRDGLEVHAVSQSGVFERNRSLRASGASPEARWWRTDLTNANETQRLLLTVRPNVVFHLAGLVSGTRDREMVLPIVHQNFFTTLNLLNAVADSGAARLILAGSIEVPGVGDSDACPCSPYAAAKWASNSYAAMYHALYQTPVVTARMSMVYGPLQWDSSKLVPYVIRSILRGERPQLSSGKRLVDWIYVGDVIAGLRAVAEAPGIEGRSIDIGSGELTPIRSVVDELASIMGASGAPDYGALVDRPLETEHVANAVETTRLIDWSATTGLSEGLRQTVAWYKTQYQASFAAAS